MQDPRYSVGLEGPTMQSEAPQSMPDPAPSPVSSDPLGMPFTLPSGGVFYGEHDGQVIVSPTRGEQEEIIAGASDGPDTARVLRHVIQQCVDTRGIKYGDLILEDWSAILLHVMAMSAGDDKVNLQPTCPAPRGCGRGFPVVKSLFALPCTEIRRSSSDDADWPPTGGDAEMSIIAEVTGEEEDVRRVYNVAPNVSEPFSTDPLPIQGSVVRWRYLRVSDLAQAEEYAARIGNHSTAPGNKMHTFLMAKHIVAIDGREVGTMEAMAWVRKQVTPVLNGFRRETERRTFGYDLRPRFKCPQCGHSFRVQLPLDADLFRGDSA